MFFVGSGAFGYEESAYEKLKIIENTYPQGYIDTGNIAERLKGGAGSPYGTPSISAEASLYGKAMAKTIRMTENLYKDYDTELKIINETIARLKSSPKNIKYEMEARNLKLNILKSKLDVIKTIVDCNTKVKKSSEDDRGISKRRSFAGIKRKNGSCGSDGSKSGRLCQCGNH